MKIQLDIPERISTNKIYSGVHWAVRARLANLYHSLLIGQPKYTGEYPIQITYRFTWRTRPYDTTNCSFLVKMLEDGLVGNGVITADDTWTVHRTIIESKKGDKDFVEIEIESL